MRRTCCFTLLTLLTLALLSGCGSSSGNNSSSTNGSQSTSGTLSMMLSDDTLDDWATIGVRVVNISLIPQGGGNPVLVYTAPNPAPMINLVQLDQLSEILGNLSVPAGTYTGAALTIAGNPGDVVLTASASPEPGFAGTPGQTVLSGNIRIRGTTGSAGSLTVPVNVNFVSPLVVTANQSNALDLEFNLSHPAFLVAHTVGASTLWAVNFNGTVRHHPIEDITRLVLRHLYGNVTAVATDGSSFTMTKYFPVMPATNPETSVASSQSLQILADGINGTIVYNVDARSHSTLFNFTSLTNTLVGKFVRVAARYQSNGTLVGVRVWYSSSFQSIWLSPEGHVLHVNAGAGTLTVENEDGTPVSLTVNNSTQFFFHAPADNTMDANPIGSGTGFLTNLVRGFKVHVSVVDPLAAPPLVADTVDIEIARFDGAMSAADAGGFTYSRTFADSADNYSKHLTFINSATKNGKDPLSGNPITGFKYWFFAFPTLVTSGPNATATFDSIVNGSVNFGGTIGALTTFGASYALWNDPASPSNWSLPWTVIAPSPIPLATVAVPWITTGSGGTFKINATGGVNAVTVNASSISGSATLVYQVDRTAGVVTISPQDLTTNAGLSNVAANLTTGTPVKVFGVPQTDGSVQTYVIFYFTGTMPTN